MDDHPKGPIDMDEDPLVEMRLSDLLFWLQSECDTLREVADQLAEGIDASDTLASLRSRLDRIQKELKEASLRVRMTKEQDE